MLRQAKQVMLDKISSEIEKIKETDSIGLNLIELQERYKKIQESRNLNELGITLGEAIRMLREKNIPAVLDESDKEYLVQNASEFDKIDDFILVHKTNYSPNSTEIKTSKNANGTFKHNFLVNGTYQSAEVPKARNTVHFAVNGEVSSHAYGNFDGRKYGILLPMEYIKDNNDIGSFRPEDTFIKGNVDITGGYLLCPQGEAEELRKQNPNIGVIEYQGENVDGYADALLSILGYKVKSIGMHSWMNNGMYDKLDSEKAFNFMKKQNVKMTDHISSDEKEEETFNTNLNILITNINLIKKLNLLDSGTSLEAISNELYENNKFFIEMMLMYNISKISGNSGKEYERYSKFYELLQKNGITPNQDMMSVIFNYSKKEYMSGIEERKLSEGYASFENLFRFVKEQQIIEKFKKDIKEKREMDFKEYISREFLGDMVRQIQILQHNNSNDLKEEPTLI